LRVSSDSLESATSSPDPEPTFWKLGLRSRIEYTNTSPQILRAGCGIPCHTAWLCKCAEPHSLLVFDRAWRALYIWIRFPSNAAAMFESYQFNLYLAVSISASLGLIIAHSVRLAPVRISLRFVCIAVLGGFLLGGAGTRLVSKTFSLAVPKNANAEIAYAREAIRSGR